MPKGKYLLTMVKASELRIGNIVFVDNEKHRPEDRKINHVVLQVGLIDCRVQNTLAGNEYGQYYKFIKPIPLTEKWHNFFGVKYNNALSEFVYELPEINNFKLTIVFGGDYVWLRQKSKTPMDDDIITLWNKDLSKRDMYVHEWQNLYYSLTANELKREEIIKEKASTP